MDSTRSFQRHAALAAMASAPLAYASITLSLASVGFDFDAFSKPLLLLQAGAAGASLWRWSMLLDIVGYYLLIVPLSLFLCGWLRSKSPGHAELYTLGLLGYSLVGAIGAAMMATIVPPLMLDYASADATRRQVLEITFTTASNMVYVGLWNLLEQLLGGIGWIGLGVLLRTERSALGTLSIVVGCCALLDFAGTVLQNETLGMVGLNAYLVLAPAWAFLLGVSLLRHPISSEA